MGETPDAHMEFGPQVCDCSRVGEDVMNDC